MCLGDNIIFVTVSNSVDAALSRAVEIDAPNRWKTSKKVCPRSLDGSFQELSEYKML